MQEYINASLKEAHSVLENFLSEKNNIDLMDSAIKTMAETLKNDGRILSCGNGGSMCDSMHFAEELTGRFRKDRAALPALSISDPAHITCVANDFGFDFIFSRYVEAFMHTGDILLAISTSGNSQNIIEAVKAAKNKNCFVVGLLGKDGGKLKDLVDIPLIVPSQISDRIQEIHIKIIHIFIEGIERNLFPENY